MKTFKEWLREKFKEDSDIVGLYPPEYIGDYPPAYFNQSNPYIKDSLKLSKKHKKKKKKKEKMKIYLRDQNQLLTEFWQHIFHEEENVHVSYGDIFAEGEHMNVQAIVSPANSFGFMDGGIDFVYSSYFGWGVETLLRAKLWQEYNGELLVGQAVLIDMREAESNNPLYNERKNKIPYLISAPTMRVPSNVAKTTNAYLAFIATLRIAKENNIESMLCPGLGTAVGQMPAEVCAVQMYEAYKRYENPRAFDVLSNPHRLHYSMLDAKTYLGSEFLI